MNVSSIKQLSERARIMAGGITRLVSGKPKLVIDCEPQASADLMEMTVNAEWLQKKLVCCECFKGECNICGYKN